MSEALEFADPGAAASLALGEAFATRAQILDAGVVRDLVLYGLSSAVALAVDWGMLALLVRQGVPTAIAAATSFSLGMIVTYVASIGVVFADRRRGSRLRELVLFVLIGIAGLGLNVLLICGLGALFGLSAPVAKVPTVAIVFLFNFAARRAMVFAAPAP